MTTNEQAMQAKQAVLLRALVLLLSVSMLLSLVGFYAGAQSITQPGSGGTSIEATTVIITKPSFTVSVSSGISLGTLIRTETDSYKTAPLSVGVTEIQSLDGKQVRVSISTSDGSFCLYNAQNDALPYEVYNQAEDGTPLASGDTYHVFTSVETVSGRVQVNEKDITAEGDYSATLTFNFSVEDAE